MNEFKLQKMAVVESAHVNIFTARKHLCLLVNNTLI